MAWSSKLGMRWSSQLSSINAQENVVPAMFAESGKGSSWLQTVRLLFQVTYNENIWPLLILNSYCAPNITVRDLNQWSLLALTVW